MGDHRSGRSVLRAGVAAVLLAGAAACSGPAADGHAAERAGLQRVLDRQAAAVHAKDERGYLAAVSSSERARGYRADQRRVFRNLERLPLAQWSYRVGEVRDRKGGGITAEVQLSYRLRDYDRAPVTTTEQLSAEQHHGHWRLTSELPGSTRQLWDQGPVRMVRGEHSMVLGVGRKPAELRALARTADRAVPAVSREWHDPWPRRVVLEVPASLRRMAQLLDAPTSSYQGIAAVTTGEAGASSKAPADRIVVNPEAYGTLSAEGRQVVMTHETVHVATRTHTSEATPLWLSEGLADFIGYRGADRTPRQAAPELARAVREGKPPRRLPTDKDFRFGGDQQAMGRAYEGSWLACRMIADRWGEDRLAALYKKVGEGREADPARLDRVLRDVLGVGHDTLVRQWRGYLERQLS